MKYLQIVNIFDNSGSYSYDTVSVDTIIMYNDDYSDNSYFRLEKNKKHLVILSSTQYGYMIDYETEMSDWIFEIIAELEEIGEKYFDKLKP